MFALKVVWRVLFVAVSLMYFAPLTYLQYVYSMAGAGYGGFGMESLFSVVFAMTTPILMPALIYIPVEVLFQLHNNMDSNPPR